MNRVLVMVAMMLGVCRCGAAGELLFQLSGDRPSDPEALERRDVESTPGRQGQALRIGKQGVLQFSSDGRLDRRQGTVCLWVRPHWDAETTDSHALFADDREFKAGNNSLLLWEWHTGILRFDVRDEQDHYLTYNVKTWRKGQWRHVAATWDCQVGTRLFVDGRLVATKRFPWVPKPSEAFRFGSKTGRAWPADADIDDARIYSLPLCAAQIERAMQGKAIQHVSYLALDLPKELAVGQPFEASIRFETPEPLAQGYAATLFLDELAIASVPLEPESTRVAVRASIPRYLYPAPGTHTVSVRVAGAFESDVQRARRDVLLRVSFPATRRGPVRVPTDGGLFLDGKFLGGPRAQQAAAAVDALPLRLVDQVDCSKKDHGYWENSPASLETLAPGRVFRCVGAQEAVTQTRMRHNTERKALAAFSYRLKVMPRPTPHLVVIESINDRERYLEVAVDHPSDSTMGAHLAGSGLGQRVAVHLSVTYSGREYPTDGKIFRQALMIFPKTDQIDVIISGTARGRYPDASPAAVSHIWVCEVATPLAELANPILLPEGQPQRTVSIFFPAVNNLFEKYGFTGATAKTRAATLRLFIDYMRFVGMNRFEFRPFELSERAWFKTPRFEQAGDLDIFAEALPLMAQADIQVVPRVMYLHSYHKLLEGDEQNFQHSVDGTIQRFGREGPIPDPLRPPVQKVVLDSVRAMLEACEGHANVPAVGFDTSIGGLYWNRSEPTSHSGYSRWDVAQFARDTGLDVPSDLDTPAKRFEWLEANAWDPWVAWRCKRWHALCTEIRDLAVADGKKLELSVRVMPREEYWTEKVPIKDIYRYTGYDPDLFRHDRDIQMDYFIRINADRYFGRPWWKTWFYDPRQPALFRSEEPRHVELYFNYWELPLHPWGFRVGPASPVGRAFFEPITYAMRTLNPHDMTFFNWFRATMGRELEIREFCRAFRALPAIEPRDFDGRIEPEPTDERLWVRWFGDRLAVVNDANRESTVTLTIPVTGATHTRVVDATLSRSVDAHVAEGRLAITLTLRPFDLRTLVFERPAAVMP